MIVDYQAEKLHAMLPELDALITAYWFSSSENDEHEPLDFDWERYCELEDSGACHVFTARLVNSHKLVGAAIYHVTTHLHHKTYVVATCDTLCTSIACRRAGIGRGLVKFCEPKLRALGAREVLHGSRHVYDVDPLFPKLGFTAFETAYSKKVM